MAPKTAVTRDDIARRATSRDFIHRLTRDELSEIVALLDAKDARIRELEHDDERVEEIEILRSELAARDASIGERDAHIRELQFVGNRQATGLAAEICQAADELNSRAATLAALLKGTSHG